MPKNITMRCDGTTKKFGDANTSVIKSYGVLDLGRRLLKTALVMIAVFTICGSGATAQTTASLLVTIHGNYIKRQLQAGVTSQIHGRKFEKELFSGGRRTTIKGQLFCKNSTCNPDFFLRRTSRVIRAHYSFKGALENFRDFSLSGNLDMEFQCSASNPELVTRIAVTDISADFPLDVEIATAYLIAEIVEEVLENYAEDAVSGMQSTISEQLNTSNLRLPVCPRFVGEPEDWFPFIGITTPAGDLVMDFAAGTQCQVEGEARTMACGPKYCGTGKEWICQNGWLWLTRDDCKLKCPTGRKCCESLPNGCCNICVPVGAQCP